MLKLIIRGLVKLIKAKTCLSHHGIIEAFEDEKWEK